MFWRKKREQDLERELQSHLDLEAEENGGDAYAARRALGNRTLVSEDTRAKWGWPVFERLLQDLRYASRNLRRNPRFTLMAAGVIALGIGPVVAIFSIVDQFLLRPLPFPEEDRIFSIMQLDGDRYGGRPGSAGPSSLATLAQWRATNTVLEDLGGAWGRSAILTGVAEPQSLTAEILSSGMFRVLGVQPVMGRSFSDEDDAAGAEPVAILGDRLWRTVFGADRGILGKSVTLGGTPFRIVGVMPPGFHGPLMRDSCDLWVPLSQPGSGPSIVNLYGRLKTSVTEKQARAQLEGMAAQLGGGLRMLSIRTLLVGDYRQELVFILAFTGILLLIGSANVANLLLARSTTRTREMVIRSAIGASAGRLMRQGLLETALVSALGGLWGIMVAAAVGPLIRLGIDLPREVAVTTDSRVLAFALGLTLLTALACGLFPSWNATRVDLGAGLQGSRSTQMGRSLRARRILLTAEIAFSLTLIAGAATFLHSFLLVRPTNPGFAVADRVVMNVGLGSAYSSPDRQIAYFRGAMDRIALQPGVRGVTGTTYMPLLGSVSVADVRTPSGESVRVPMENVGPGYFRVMRIPMKQGREFNERDREGAPNVATVNEAFVSRFFNGQSPIGREFTFSRPFGSPQHAVIVGVVGNVQSGIEPGLPPPFFYLPFLQAPSASMTIIVDTPSPLNTVAPALRAALVEIDSNQPIRSVETMEALINARMFNIPGRAYLTGIAAMIALLLSASGIYAIASYNVTQRSREFGIRAALGANKAHIVRLVAAQNGVYIVGGVLLGCAGAWGGIRLLTKVFWRTYPIGPGAIAALAFGFVLAAAVATLPPVVRALRVDPAVVLRDE